MFVVYVIIRVYSLSLMAFTCLFPHFHPVFNTSKQSVLIGPFKIKNITIIITHIIIVPIVSSAFIILRKLNPLTDSIPVKPVVEFHVPCLPVEVIASFEFLQLLVSAVLAGDMWVTLSAGSLHFQLMYCVVLTF